MAIKRYTEIKSWKMGVELVETIYKITNNNKFLRGYSLKDQIRRASVSVPSNIAEGFGRQSNKEFIKFLYYSKRSILEVETQAIIAYKLKYIEKNLLHDIHKKSVEIEKLISGLIKSMQ